MGNGQSSEDDGSPGSGNNDAAINGNTESPITASCSGDDEDATRAVRRQARDGGDGVGDEVIGNDNVRAYRKLDFDKLRRSQAEVPPMSKLRRFRSWMLRNSSKKCAMHRATKPKHIRGLPTRQYSIPPKERRGPMRALSLFCGLRFVDFTVWMVQCHYLYFVLVSLILYFVGVNIFAFIFTFMAATGAKCLTNWVSEDDGVFGDAFERAFELSWTTWSTVGYGAISPASDIMGCWPIRYVSATEAFVGVIYFAYVGAIFFAKIGRIDSRAHVVFSSTVCIQFGTGVEEKQDVGDANSTVSECSLSASHLSCPVLTFRIVNTKGNSLGWEVLGADLQGIVLIDTPVGIGKNNQSFSLEDPDSSMIGAYNYVLHAKNGMSPDAAMKMTVRKIAFESSSHPYFRRVWYPRHVLNCKSPLLTEEAKERIRECGGTWPAEMNSFREIRKALVKFSTLGVTLTGTSYASSETIFTGTRYYFDDILVGWQYAPMLYVTTDGLPSPQNIKMDLHLTHDVLPQAGGGEEPLDLSNKTGQSMSKVA